MTTMYPSSISAKARRGERDMFFIIRNDPRTEEYVCLHSLGLARHGRKEFGEADFVVVGPMGVFSLEVKGGEVSRENGVWTIGPPGDTYESKEGPFEQSRATIYPLRDFIKERVGLGRHDFLSGWGVAFPHITFRVTSPEWDNAVIYDERDKDAPFTEYLGRLEKFWLARRAAQGDRAPKRLTGGQIRQIANALRGDFDLVPTVKSLIGESRRELAILSPAQFAVLDFALNEHNRAILCDGAAGTGKTLVAMEAARRLAADGQRVLLLCFNAHLGRFLEADASETEGDVQIATVHSFLMDTIRRAGLKQQLASVSSTKEEFFAEVVPDLFEKAAFSLLDEGALPQFDTLIIDEAQDVLNAPLLGCLDLVLAGGFKEGRWLMFLDSGAQAKLYGQMNLDVLHTLRSFRPAEFALKENFRNPKAVVYEMCEVTGIERPLCRRMLSSKVDYRLFLDERDQGRKLRALLVELIKDGVQPSAITVLSTKARADACISCYPPDIGKPIVWLEDIAGNSSNDSVTACSISGFKGLENEVMVLTDAPSIDPLSDWARSALYVGMTRARAKLFMLVNQAYIDARTRC